MQIRSAAIGTVLALMMSCVTTTPEQVKTVRYPIDVLWHNYPAAGPRQWCYQSVHPKGVTCFDGLIGTNTWPDKTVLCLDVLRPDWCFEVGDLRGWVRRRARRVPADNDS